MDVVLRLHGRRRVVTCAALLLAQVRSAVDRGRRESEQHLREVEGPREHWPVAGGEFEQPPLGTPELAEPKVPAGDHLPNLGEREAAGDQRLRERAVGGLLEPQGWV